MKNFAVLLIFSLVFASISQAQLSPQIIGGGEVANSHPVAKHTVLIIGKIARASFTCTGVVYSKNLILTAGHCLGGPGYADLTVYFRTQKNGSGPAIKVVEQLRAADIPTDSRPFDWNDIALLKLATPIPDNYSPAKLVLDSSEVRNGDEVLLAGYGRTVAAEPASGDGGLGTLRSVSQKILEIQYGSSELLVDIRGKGSCSGDSGGPAFIINNNELAVLGIASRLSWRNIVPGSKPVRYECTTDLIYTKISAQKEWLEKTALKMTH